jgi:hypothetical protein
MSSNNRVLAFDGYLVHAVPPLNEVILCNSPAIMDFLFFH